MSALIAVTTFAAVQRQLPPPRDVSRLARAAPMGAKEAPRVTFIGEVAAPPRQNEFTLEFPLRCRVARFGGREENVFGTVWVVLPRAETPRFSEDFARREYSRGEELAIGGARPALATRKTESANQFQMASQQSGGGETGAPNDGFAAGDIIQVRAALYDIPRARNAGEVSRASYYIAHGCWCVARAERFRAAKKLRAAQGFARVLDGTRRNLAALYRRRLASTRSRENAAPARPYQRATAVLLTSLVFGEGATREALPRATSERYRAAGLSHLLVASGTQISLLAVAAIFVARIFALRGVALIFATAIPLFFYSELAGGEASIWRAFIAGLCVVAALSLGRAIDALSLWSLALGIFLLLDPAQISNIGLQLSFAATWGLLALAPALRVLATSRAPQLPPTLSKPDANATASTRDLETKSASHFGAAAPEVPQLSSRAARELKAEPQLSWLPAPMALLLAVQMATLPVQIAHFGAFSAAALPANALALPLAACVTFCGTLALLFSVFATPAYGFTRALDALCSLAASATGAQLSVSVSRAAVFLLVALPFALCGTAAITRALRNVGGAWRDSKIIARHETVRLTRQLQRKMQLSPRRAWALLAACAMFCALLIFLNTRRAPLRVAFLDVGQGDSIIIRTPSGKTILIDGGSGDVRRGDVARGVIVPALQSLGATQLDAIIMTHADSDHCNALAGVMREIPTKMVIDGAAGTNAGGDFSGEYSRLKRVWRAQNVTVQAAHLGQTIDCGDGVRLRVLAPRGGMNGFSENDRSAVTRLQFGEVSMLFTGDLEFSGEEALLQSGENVRATVLKVGHHGSRGASSAAFLKRVAPRVAVISCGRFNRYGHPAPDALSRLESASAEIFRTDRDGEVDLSCDEKSCAVTTFR